MADDEKKEDRGREEYVARRVSGLLYTPAAKITNFIKNMMSEDNIRSLNMFFSDPDMMFLLCQNVSGDNYNFVTEIPAPISLKKKGILLIRSDRGIEIEDGNIEHSILFMEFSKNSLQHMSRVLQDVYLPVLNNQGNQKGWSDLVSKDLMDKYHNFLGYIYVTIGLVQGRTLLPLPPADATTSTRTTSKDKAHVLEGAIITWTKQIKNVLKQDPETALKQGSNPGPLIEIEFWKNKAENLNSIHQQLQSDKIKKVTKFLEQNKSTYTIPFSKLQKEVQAARTEANSNFKYLQTLEKWFLELIDDTKELVELPDLFVPIMHIILLIWNHSEYYNKPARLVVLIREICNAIIVQACNFISGQDIFALIQDEGAAEACNKLGLTLDVCSKFRETFFEYKSKANNTWTITTNALFVRLDAFTERCQDIQHLTKTIVQFGKLAKIEIGGTKGKTLTTSVSQIYKEFQDAVEKFQGVGYDIMDISQKRFDDDFYEFRCSIKELERRLGSVLTQGFDDSDTIYGRFKLLDSFEGLLNRPIIQDELEKKHIILLESYKQDLKIVQSVFMEGKVMIDKKDDRAPVYKNLPPVAGALNWTRSLMERIKEPMEKLSTFNKAILDREEYKDVQKLYASLMKGLADYEKKKVEEWFEEVDGSSDEKLEQPLLRKDDDTLSVNFDPALVRLLREVKYFSLLGQDTPDKAQDIYSHAERYRTQVSQLDMIVDTYNNIRATLHPVEEPLVHGRIERMDQILEEGFDTLKWKNAHIREFIDNSMSCVEEVNTIVTKMKDNLKNIQDLMEKWAERPLFERKQKNMRPEDFDQQHKAAISQRHMEISQGSKNIRSFIKDTFDYVKANRNSDEWKNYLDYVSGIIVEGIAKIITNSLTFFANQIDASYLRRNELGPLFDVNIDLIDKVVLFDPELNETAKKSGIRDLINGWIADFVHVATLVQRIDSNPGDYTYEIRDHMLIQELLSIIAYNLHLTEAGCNNFKSGYEEYSYLWTENINDTFNTFLEHDVEVEKHVEGDSEDEKEDLGIEHPILQGVVTKMPPMAKFDEKVSALKAIKHKISEFKTPTNIGWLRINSKPIKVALDRVVTEWIKTYTGFLNHNVSKQMENMQNFMEKTNKGIAASPAEDPSNKQLLMNVMERIRDVRLFKDSTDAMFGNLKEQILLLKKHDVAMDQDPLNTLDQAKNLWTDTKNQVYKVQEAILPLQAEETKNIKVDLDNFNAKVKLFRDDFLKNCPYQVTDFNIEIINQSYGSIDLYHQKLQDIRVEAREYNNLETLFELEQSSYKALNDCRKEIELLKQLWDMVGLVIYKYNDWKTTLWDKIDTGDLIVQNKNLNDQIKVMPREVRSWKTYTSLLDKVKNMNTILPLISELHSDCMEKRHWATLMTITKKEIANDSPSFCLEDLIKLELFRYAEDVQELVAGATKEKKIEKKLKIIMNEWGTLEFEFDDYKETKLLAPLDDTIEKLEEHSMALASMLSQGKNVEFVRDTVVKWQKTLRNVESIIRIWIKVQKNWKRLETIFLASEDIRAQLPEDTKKFEKVDETFRDLMKEVSELPIIVEACEPEDREEKLYSINGDIESCEKSLNDYLEQKKKAFPRFYFVSNQALLDILSNGNNPQKVAEYLGDCFDGMKTLDFIKDDSGKPTKGAKGMFSKEGEYVPLSNNFYCEGAVENWLAALEDAMKLTLRNILEHAKGTSDNWELDNPREEWIYQYCAQIALLCTQIVWTEEVNKAFDDLESGSETAMKDYLRVCNERIEKLIKKVQGTLTPEQRTKIITIITIDVHSRDVVDRFVNTRLSDSNSFAWQSQLKLRWKTEPDPGEKPDKFEPTEAKICDWMTRYSYEYVGNCGRLVITPLTDRCYITLTQALNLIMGGAPAGPAGTGKTETTKDLGRALGLPVFVFNCSEQMNYSSMAQIFMGLSQAGAWGCFDEFNRILIEVLSVVSTQVKTILDALKERKVKFMFMEEEIVLRTTVGFFITMNPGYAGRTELPENLKALFRSCAMVVPDLMLICENMLLSEGFVKARALSRKFVTLYNLSKELLSKQTHYDWGLRAVKSVLRQAGMIKRSDPEVDEDPLLMRALRDFNKPKIVADDKPIFFRLIEDLFPNTECEPKVDADLQKACIKVAKDNKMQPEEAFILKAVQLDEILSVRHCCFLIGPSGCGKTSVWKTLAAAHKERGEDCIYETVNPKAVTSNELFGHLTKTKEWKDGVLSTIMRDQSKNQGPYKESHVNKWIILDGDIDPEWIESLNTVMDDNKMLTLVSNERIPLSSAMRLLFEVANLRNATPATVSRGGVLFINEADIGWKPYMESWVDAFVEKFRDEDGRSSEVISKIADNARSVFYFCFDQYIDGSILEQIHGFQTIVPTMDISMIQTICTILASLVTPEDMAALRELKEEEQKTLFEAYFIYAAMWAIGGPLIEEDKYKSFNIFWRNTAKVKFPEGSNCFDFFYDIEAKNWVHWTDRVVNYEAIDQLFVNIIVPTVDTVRLRSLIRLHMHENKPILFVGSAGTGKTTVVKDYFSNLPENLLSATINFNSYTDSAALQSIMEGYVEKRSGRKFGPPTNMQLIYFLDDLNMPFVDKYGTQTPIALIRQLIDYQSMYDREHLDEKKYVEDVLFLGCMNHKAGSFNINPRLQRHFTTLSCGVPPDEVTQTIYTSILNSHLKTFDGAFESLGAKIVSANLDIYRQISENPQFSPTTLKFHYQFNLRDLGRIMEGVMLAQPNQYKNNTQKLIRLWIHECVRVYEDRLIFDRDVEVFRDYLHKAVKKVVEAEDLSSYFAEPLLFTSFYAQASGADKTYIPIEDMEQLKKVLEDKLHEYNETNSVMSLVLFNQAMEHICKIARIIDLPNGNALLVGVGGSGKQSLSRLASFILEYDVVQILVSANYNINDLKTDLQEMYRKTGVRPASHHSFILTDTQIQDETFLVFINDLLSSGIIPDLFTKDEYEGIYNSVRNEAKASGYADSPDQLFEFFIDRVRRNLHVLLCFSPVGETFRVRARKFPGLINSTTIDWFHPWPYDALIDVASRFLVDVELPTEEVRNSISLHMAFVHASIDGANKKFQQIERKFNYTTPTSFLELIDFYKKLLAKKNKNVDDQITRLTTGLHTLQETKEQVEGLQEELRIKMIDVEAQREETNKLIEIVGKNSAFAEEEQAAATIEEEKTKDLSDKAQTLQSECETELSEALPAFERAKGAVDCLTLKSIQELKSLKTPPAECTDVCKVVSFMLKGLQKKFEWSDAQKMMREPDKFLKILKNDFNAEEIDENILTAIRPVMDKPWFNGKDMKKKSEAASYMCEWAVNIVDFNTIYKKVKPLQDRSDEAKAEVEKSSAALAIVQERVREINEKVDGLKKELMEAEETKARVEREAQECLDKLNLAERLVNGLADENKRWGQNVQILKESRKTLVGDALISAAFVSYIGAFSSEFRTDLWADKWLPDIREKEIPSSVEVDPLYILATDSNIAKWKNEGLPADRISLENAAIINSCARWPLMIDPQLQGAKWIRGKEGDELMVIQLSQDRWLKKLEAALSNGKTLLIESIGQEVDPILDPVLSRSYFKRGKELYIKLGGEEMEYDPSFKLYIQTKWANPHYKPETSAQCTMINFRVTENGLEDQLLAMVVNKERPELEAEKTELVRKQNEFKVELAGLEDDLLTQLAEADPSTILTNTDLIENLEKTKVTSRDITEQSIQAKETEEKINVLREVYRLVATEGAMLYFLIIQLCIVDHMYQYSLDSFVTFFYKAIDKTPADAEVDKRTSDLREMIRVTIFQWVSRGLFEKHKLLFLLQITLRLMQKGILPENPYDSVQVQYLLKCPLKSDVENPLKEWLPNNAWYAVQALVELPGFENFAVNMERDAPGRFKDWFNELAPEEQKLPLEWKKLDNQPFQKMLVLRALRPDRITTAMATFIRSALPSGSSYVDLDSGSSFNDILASSLDDAGTTTPIFFILSPGADPVKEVEKLGKKMGYENNKNFHNVALGQGQDVVAMAKLEIGHREGHWVMLQNIHLMPRWCLDLEKKLEAFELEGSHPKFRLFLSAEPSSGIPIGVLERSIKLTNEPPQGVKANLKRAFTFFSKEEIEDKDPKVKTVLFALCFFHTTVIERKKFGPKGWNMSYPFNMGDLRDSAIVLNNYLESSGGGKLPWDDLKYIFGEIMYGGHIVDDWDRRLCNTYLENIMKDQLVLDEFELFPFVDGKEVSFKTPPPGTYDKYLEHIEMRMGPENETPLAFGLHPNAEIGYKTMQCNQLFGTLQELQPRDRGAAEEGARTPADIAGEIVNRIKEDLNLDHGLFNLDDLNKMIDEKGPFQNVLMQECEYMTTLVSEILKSLDELDRAFRGELTMTEQMEDLVDSLFLDRVPASWAKLAYPSIRGLGSWLGNLVARIEQLNMWKEDPMNIPKVTIISRLFNPQSFLTAIKQATAQKHSLELNKLMIATDIRKTSMEETDYAAKEGAYVFGFNLEGGRWDTSLGVLDECKPKEMFNIMPVVNCRAVLVPEGKEDKSIYQCPVYKTEQRGATYVFTAQLKTKASPLKWILAGVAIVMDVEGIGDTKK